ncbi:MAG: phosphopentomutase [Gemmatimonadaceae bacterium]
MTKRAVILVLDGVGMGEAPDAENYGDRGSDTLAHVVAEVGSNGTEVRLENLVECGIGNIKAINELHSVTSPAGAFGMMSPASAGKDSTTGHWEIAGVHLASPFPTYPHGFPEPVLAEFARLTGRGVIANVVGSGTDVLAEFGEEHLRAGAWIVYTSADSVFQIAAHEAVVPLPELYAACETARAMLVPPNDVSRVIARPFMGEPGAFRRTANRRDFSVQPPSETLLDALEHGGIARAGVGKIDDLFAGRGIRSRHTASNAEGIQLIQEWLESDSDGLLFANLVDFDQLYGHRNDSRGFYGALREFDAALPALRRALRQDDLLFITADHGNDPTTPSTNHARENVPLLVLGPRASAGTALGRRDTFSDLGATVADWLGVPFRGAGQSFLGEIVA